MKHFVAIAGLALLAGCASLSEEECLSGDWAGIGQRDGAAGRVAETQFARHVKACEAAGVTPQRSAWQAGYAQGLQSYCTPSSGLDAGLAGRSYRNVCPATSESGFLRGFEIGTADHKARAEVSGIQRKIARLQARNREIIGVIGDDGETDLRLELSNNRSEILRLQLELGFARAEAARTRRAVAAFRAG